MGLGPFFWKERGRWFTERLVSSESVVCQSIGFENDRDVSPGEAIIVRMDGKIHSKNCHSKLFTHHVFSSMFTLQDQTQ